MNKVQVKVYQTWTKNDQISPKLDKKYKIALNLDQKCTELCTNINYFKLAKSDQKRPKATKSDQNRPKNLK